MVVLLCFGCYILQSNPTNPRLPNPWPAMLFCVRARYFCEVDFLVERRTISGQINRSKPKPSSDWFSQNQLDLRRRPFFFFGFHLVLGTDSHKIGKNQHRFSLWSSPTFGVKIPETLAKVSTDFVQQTCNYLEFNIGKNACGPWLGTPALI